MILIKNATGHSSVLFKVAQGSFTCTSVDQCKHALKQSFYVSYAVWVCVFYAALLMYFLYTETHKLTYCSVLHLSLFLFVSLDTEGWC